MVSMSKNIAIALLCFSLFAMYIRELRLAHPFISINQVELTAKAQQPLSYNPVKDYVSAPKPVVKRIAERKAIIISGPITEDTLTQFKAALTPETEVVMIASPGGDLIPAVEISKIIYNNHIATLVPRKGMCYSACTIIFQAGSVRMAYEDSMFMYHSAKMVNEKTGEEKPDMAATSIYWAFLVLYGMDDGLLLRTDSMTTDYFVPAKLATKYSIVTDLISLDTPSEQQYID